jgi:hypothetical protein
MPHRSGPGAPLPQSVSVSAECSLCFSPLQLTGESTVMENGLVSQHAYTMIGAEQVRVAFWLGISLWGSNPCSYSSKQEPE